MKNTMREETVHDTIRETFKRYFGAVDYNEPITPTSLTRHIKTCFVSPTEKMVRNFRRALTSRGVDVSQVNTRNVGEGFRVIYPRAWFNEYK